MSSTNGRCNSAERGSSYARRRRKLWLLSPEAGWGGDGFDVPCWECGVLLEFEDLVPDRIIPGERGGTYARWNIAPHCLLCSCRQGQRRTMDIRRGVATFVGYDEEHDVFSYLTVGVELPAGFTFPGSSGAYWEPMLDSG